MKMKMFIPIFDCASRFDVFIRRTRSAKEKEKNIQIVVLRRLDVEQKMFLDEKLN